MVDVCSFDPVFDSDSCVLILGTIPSVISRENNFYYANPKNAFWRIMAEICLEKTVPQTIDAKKRMLLNNRIALWDVCKACNVKGSLDSSIKNVEPNDIGSLINASRIKVIFFNGKKACQLFERHFKYNDIGVPDRICLPSTSPANTTRYEIKLDEWKKNVTKYLDCFKKG